MSKINMENSIHTDDIQDIIIAPPSWVLRWGICIFFSLTILLIMLSAFIKYPDVVRTSLKLISTDTPMIVQMKSSGKLMKLLVSNNSVIKQGQELAYLEMPAISEDIIRLSNNLEELKAQLPAGKLLMTFPSHLNVEFPQRIQLGYKTFDIALIAFESVLKERSIHHFAQSEIRSERTRLLIAIDELIREIETWKDKFIIISPCSGTLFYNGFLRPDQILYNHQKVFYIKSDNEFLYGEMVIPQNSIGKIKIGQVVIMKFRSYPYEEFGILKGKIKDIADLNNNDSVFISEVDIGESRLIANHSGMQLKSGMHADAEIITHDVTVLQRIIKSLNKTIK